MPKSQPILVGSLPDPLYDPLPPSVDDLILYEQDILDECPYITYEWATKEIREHLLNWVRVGLVAEKVRYLKLWQGRFSSWQEYCQGALGKSQWQIARIIKASRVTMTLAHLGFEILPTCEAQASKLVKFLSDLEQLSNKWTEVIESVPKHLISANAIGRVFGEEPKKKRINVKSDLHERLERKARDLGISVEQLLEGWLEEDETIEPESHHQSSTEEPAEAEEAIDVDRAKMARWQTDLEAIVKEHDFHNWLTLVWFKFLVPV